MGRNLLVDSGLVYHEKTPSSQSTLTTSNAVITTEEDWMITLIITLAVWDHSDQWYNQRPLWLWILTVCSLLTALEWDLSLVETLSRRGGL